MKPISRLVALVLALLIPLSGAFAANGQYSVTEEEYELLQKYKRLEEIVRVIDANFLFEYDEDKLLEGAAQGIFGVLGDDYSFYYTPQMMTSENESFTGEYGGLGIEVGSNMKDQMITIRRVFYGSPAQQNGLQVNDKIIQVNGKDVTAYDLNEAVSMMRGEVGGQVDLTLLREKELIKVTLTRAIIETEILTSEILEDKIGYIRIYYFEGNATGQFEDTIARFKEQGIEGLVIDLRDNPGGFINHAFSIADVFLDDKLITTTEDKYGRKLSQYSKRGAWEIPLVVLINEHSASAAEILAAALSENGVAELVGVNSYGKGIMQTVQQFAEDGAGMQLTTDYWLTPNGNNIHKIGIEPDVEVELPEDAFDDNYQIIPGKDTQLIEAVRVLTEQIAENK